jgi:hypothetical protein
MNVTIRPYDHRTWAVLQLWERADGSAAATLDRRGSRPDAPDPAVTLVAEADGELVGMALEALVGDRLGIASWFSGTRRPSRRWRGG